MLFQRLRSICLALPEAIEVDMDRGPSFRVTDKIFANERRLNGRPSVWCKAPPGSQAVLIGVEPRRFFSPPHFGVKGWVGMWLDDDPHGAEVEVFVRRGYRLVAPKRLMGVAGV
jgi:predicted DNA-binding protein (MmcQ/YjbR family)